MALPTLDAAFASSADLPRKQMLAKWLIGELGETQAPSSVLVSGAGSSAVNGIYTYNNQYGGKPYYNLQGYEDNVFANSIYWDADSWILSNVDASAFYAITEEIDYPWLSSNWQIFDGESPVPTFTEIPPSNYYSLPERYLLAKIAVAAGGPKTEATYISLPKNYVWSDIYNAISGDIANSIVVVSGAGTEAVNGAYARNGTVGGKPSYLYDGNSLEWSIGSAKWIIVDGSTGDAVYTSDDNVTYPWQVTTWAAFNDGISPLPILTPQTPNHTDWTENVALGHIAAAYRGDTGNPANLATYIDWPWRYKVASIILAL